MKLLGILWNSIGEYVDEATDDIKKYCNVKYYDLDLGKDYKNFLLELYPFNESEKWKAEFKVNGLVDKYKSNKIRILILDIPKDEKVYLKNKDKMMYKNVLELKVFIRKKYEHLVTQNVLKDGKSYDNVFHMTDDEDEYIDNLPIILKYLPKHLKTNEDLMSISDFVDPNLLQREIKGTRNKYWITPNLLFKENYVNTFENYSEVFNMYFMRLFGLNNCAEYMAFSCFDKPGVLTKRITDKNEEIVFLDEIFNKINIFEKKDLILHNNLNELPNILNNYCKQNNLTLDNDYYNQLRKIYLYDILTCQNDRNPTNMCLKYDDQTRIAKLYFFDNSNMLFFYQADLLKKYIDGHLDISSYLENKTSTFLLNKASDLEICFNNKIYHLKSFLENQNNFELFNDFLNIFNPDNINLTFNYIEQNENIKLPYFFKKAILDYYQIFICKLKEIQTENAKILRLNNIK